MKRCLEVAVSNTSNGSAGGFMITLTMEMALIKAVVVAREKVKVVKVEQELISEGQARVYSMVVCFERC